MAVTVPSTGAPSTSPSEPLVSDVDVDITDPASVLERVGDAASELVEGVVDRVPVILLAIVVFVVGFVVVGAVHRVVVRSTAGGRLDTAVARLVQTLSRAAMVALVVLFALNVAGVDVGSALAALGIVGLALAFAVQSILENFIAGILLLVRRPFRPGDQVQLGDHAGVVDDVDLRVTRLIDYDGEVVLLPNAQVFSAPIINRTHRGRRRTTVMVGVDYRDDHDAARAVLLEAVRGVGGVLASPQPVVQLEQLGESSVDFALRYWTMPEQAEVLRVRDAVLSAAKSAVEANGMTIPWPIRTLVVDPDAGEDAAEVLRGRGRGRPTDG